MFYRLLFSGLLLFVFAEMNAQDCTTFADAQIDVVLPVSDGGSSFRSGVAYHPAFEAYYSVNGGFASYPIEAFSPAGELLFSEQQAFDFRGFWYNPVREALEGNGFGNNGVFTHTLDVDGLPTGTGELVLAVNQPDRHATGDLDVDNNLFVYYFNGKIYRYDATDNAAVDTLDITNLPVEFGNLNERTIAYVGCPEQEYGVYDYVNKKLYYIDGTTGEYSGETKLPDDAPLAQITQMSYANNRLFLYDIPARLWKGYRVVDVATSTREMNRLDVDFTVYPNPTTDALRVQLAGNNNERLTVELNDVFGRLLISKTFTPGLSLDPE